MNPDNPNFRTKEEQRLYKIIAGLEEENAYLKDELEKDYNKAVKALESASFESSWPLVKKILGDALKYIRGDDAQTK